MLGPGLPAKADPVSWAASPVQRLTCRSHAAAGEVRVVVRLVPRLVEPGRAQSEVAIRLGELFGAASRPQGDYCIGTRFDSVKFPR